jgi:hypothetical protein
MVTNLLQVLPGKDRELTAPQHARRAAGARRIPSDTDTPSPSSGTGTAQTCDWRNTSRVDGNPDSPPMPTHGETVEFAKVSGDRIVSDKGATSTPAIFANRRAKGCNAWHLIWLRFPGDKAWIRADDCRAPILDSLPRQG